MRRREFITLLGGAAAWPVAAWPVAVRAQQAERMRHIGVLQGFAENDPEAQSWMAAFLQALQKLGWTEGRNLRIDYRWAAGVAERIPGYAAELVELAPEVIFATTPAVVAELHRKSRTIPIVFVAVTDPIGLGVVESLARPGGNITGFLVYEASITGKWLAMLKEMAPYLTRAALVANPKTHATDFEYFLKAATMASAPLAVEVVPTPVESAGDITRAFEAISRVPKSGLIVPPNSTTIVHRDLIIALAAEHRLPAVYSLRMFVAAGGLMSYGVVRTDEFRQAATYVDRILRGAKPADLPVQNPVKFETVVNLKTAKALGLTVPPGLLVAADEVIE
jgi:putative ABC transport system substrate-binding protein